MLPGSLQSQSSHSDQSRNSIKHCLATWHKPIRCPAPSHPNSEPATVPVRSPGIWGKGRQGIIKLMPRMASRMTRLGTEMFTCGKLVYD